MSVTISNLGKTSLVFVQPGGKVDSSYYYDVVLNQGLLPDIHKLSGNNFTLQQDGAQLIVHDKQLHSCVFVCENLRNQKIGRRIAQTVNPVVYFIQGVRYRSCYRTVSQTTVARCCNRWRTH